MSHYIYQQFLLNCAYETVDQKEAEWGKDTLPQYLGVAYNLLDILDGRYDRSIPISQIDAHFDTHDDFQKLLAKIQNLTSIVLVDDRPTIKNPILKDYSDATLKAYIYRIREAGIQCYYIPSCT